VLLTPYIIRKLGDGRYGIWALAFALIEYVFLFDLGFRSAIVTFVSRYRVEGNIKRINEVINTSLGYLLGVAMFVVMAAFFRRGFRVPAETRRVHVGNRDYFEYFPGIPGGLSEIQSI
jgi:O-antigen/teichoic acid export membrane protein